VSTPYESFGKYILLEKLATGGMAEVFLARGSGASGIGKFFAIKRILPQYADSPEFNEMFKDEAKIAINLNHSNIVSIHEFGVEKGQFFLVMDYVEGRNLRQILNKMKKSNLQFSVEQIVFLIKEVAAGLDHAHRCLDGNTGKPLNITHRDMSPQNVMVSFEGEVKIVDFGIAKAESQLETTRAGTLKGKFGYMSPEQAEGLPVDLRTDIFSLGIVTWELLANDRLFVANNEINTLRKIRDCQIPSLRKINPNINAEVERISQKALARDRNLRYQTGAAFQRDLNRFLNRQYPDFSTQDFSVFIKSVFADEILTTRKRLVDYAKLNFGSGGPIATSTFNDRSSLLDTDTNSLVISVNDGNEDISKQATRVADTGSHRMPDEKTQATERTEITDSLELGTPAPEIAAPTLPVNITATGNEARRSAPSSATKNPSVLDSSALEAESHRELAIPTIRDDDYDGGSGGGGFTRPSISRRRRPSENHDSHSGSNNTMRAATFLVFSLLCLSVYSYLVKYFTPMMTDVIAVTDPYLHELHAALDVNVVKQGSTTTASSAPAGQQVPPMAPRPAPPRAAVPTPPLPPPAAVVEETAVVVISNPSGAEVLINDKSTGLFTPTRVEIPAEKFDITIRKHGFNDTKMRDVTREKIGHRIVANLVKMNVAYLDIDVLPPQEALIYINGKLLNSKRGPIRDLPVQANTPLRVRVETRNLSAYDEIIVNVPVDKKQFLRVPTSED
jgi:serine/threonine protein kinase